MCSYTLFIYLYILFMSILYLFIYLYIYKYYIFDVILLSINSIRFDSFPTTYLFIIFVDINISYFFQNKTPTFSMPNISDSKLSVPEIMFLEYNNSLSENRMCVNNVFIKMIFHQNHFSFTF